MPIEPREAEREPVGGVSLASSAQPPAPMLATPERKRKKKEPKCRKPGWRRVASSETAPDSKVQTTAA